MSQILFLYIDLMLGIGMDRLSFSEKQFCQFHICLPFQSESILNGKNLLSQEQILFMRRALLEEIFIQESKWEVAKIISLC